VFRLFPVPVLGHAHGNRRVRDEVGKLADDESPDTPMAAIPVKTQKVYRSALWRRLEDLK
jgi:hypothetical protein